jgi:hypothetical protein
MMMKMLQTAGIIVYHDQQEPSEKHPVSKMESRITYRLDDDDNSWMQSLPQKHAIKIIFHNVLKVIPEFGHKFIFMWRNMAEVEQSMTKHRIGIHRMFPKMMRNKDIYEALRLGVYQILAQKHGPSNVLICNYNLFVESGTCKSSCEMLADKLEEWGYYVEVDDLMSIIDDKYYRERL